MEFSTLTTLALGVLGFVVNIIVLAVAGVWQLSRVEYRVVAEVNKNRNESFAEMERLRREIGEIALALRQKMTDIELFTRDTFVRRESFFELMRRGEKQLETQFQSVGIQFDKLDLRVSKLDDKLDQLAVQYTNARD